MEKIIIEGNLDTSGSYAIVNISLAESLLELGFDVSLLPFDTSAKKLSKHLLINNSKLQVADRDASCDIRIRMVWPPIWTKYSPDEKLVVLQPWEFGSIPISWIEGVASADQVWVPTEFVKACYVQSGVDHKKIRVIPYGVNSDALKLGAEKLSNTKSTTYNDPFRLLFLGGAIFRKGVDLLMDGIALLSAAEQSKLRLTIKKVGSGGAYLGQSLVEQKLTEHPEIQTIVEIIDEHLDQRELYDLIQGSDALIHPYRGEGFGMPVLEAMALGTPVIHTANGPTNEFCTSDISVLIKSDIVVQDIPVVSNSLLSDRLWYLECSPIDIANTLRNVLTYRYELPQFAKLAHERAKSYLWEHIASKAVEHIQSLANSQHILDAYSIITDAMTVWSQSPVTVDLVLQVVQQLTNLGDFQSALTLIDASDADSNRQLKQIREQLFTLANTRKDLWSKSHHRELINNLSASNNNRLVAHVFEGSDDQTYQIALHLSQYFAGRRKVLDIGCGQGSMLRALRERGIDAIGIEADPVLVSNLRSDGFTVFEGWLSETLNDIEISSFDGVFMGHIIEHLQPSHAEEIFKWIHSRIDDGGTILLQTPDFTNPFVTSFNFWLDSTNIRLYPIELMKEMLKAAGFAPIEGACRRISEIAPLDVIAMAKKVNHRSTQKNTPSNEVTTNDQSSLSVAYMGLFQGNSGFSKDCATLLSD
ncbi:methyltransferase domain-containing protein [Acidithrix sp. C25]|uniref:methyltransferase domain-containing protein n=1 Tax=Acidithrix sp. C25 TaxID=1671482 RepID=UPI00191BC491|nr:methyltransferase domain-containing protein [Acidithrix sp. C25]